MHILAIVAVVLFAATFFFLKWLLTALGVLKPKPVVPSGYPIGHKGTYRVKRSSAAATRFMDAHERMIKISIHDNGELWRVLSYTPALDDTYEFTMQRVE